MAQTVNECLTAATDSVTLINDVNTNGASSKYIYDNDTQAEINERIQRNVNHLGIILAYAPGCGSCGNTGESEDDFVETCYTCSGTGIDPNDETPDIVGYSGDKSSYTGAITTGNAYIAANS